MQPQIFSDEPTLDDFIDHRDYAAVVADMAMLCTPPYVLGIHGDWGTGRPVFSKRFISGWQERTRII